MTRPEVMWRRATRLALLLVAALGVPASAAPFATEMSDVDADTQRRADTPSASSRWSAPAAPAPVVVQPPDQLRPVPERARSANPLWAIPLATLSSTRERPIFSSSRRPPPPPAVAAVPVAKPPPPPPTPPRVERPQLSLVGTIVADDDQSFGIFVDQTTDLGLRLRIGEDHKGWKLRSVHARDVTLERDQQTAILSLPQPSDDPAGPMRRQAENALNPQKPVDAPLQWRR
jgi:hypothetical protein